jgi:hypothetical protein
VSVVAAMVEELVDLVFTTVVTASRLSMPFPSRATWDA